MATSSPFNYNSLYSQLSVPVVRGENRHAKYDFAVAYPDPETLPLEGLADSLKVALEREGKDLALYPVSAGLPSLREWVAEKLARDRNMNVGVDDIVLTSGSGEAISMLIAALTDRRPYRSRGRAAYRRVRLPGNPPRHASVWRRCSQRQVR